MFPFQPFYPFHFDSHIGCCLRSIFGYIQSPDFFATLAFPRAIDHDIDFTVYAERFQVKNQVGIGIHCVKVEILIPDSRAVGVVDYSVMVVFRAVWILESSLVAIERLNV